MPGAKGNRGRKHPKDHLEAVGAEPTRMLGLVPAKLEPDAELAIAIAINSPAGARAIPIAVVIIPERAVCMPPARK